MAKGRCLLHLFYVQSGMTGSTSVNEESPSQVLFFPALVRVASMGPLKIHIPLASVLVYLWSPHTSALLLSVTESTFVAN